MIAIISYRAKPNDVPEGSNWKKGFHMIVITQLEMNAIW